MPEVAAPRENHREAEAVGGCDDLGVTNGPTRLRHRRHTRRGQDLDPVGEREEGIAARAGTFQ